MRKEGNPWPPMARSIEDNQEIRMIQFFINRLIHPHGSAPDLLQEGKGRELFSFLMVFVGLVAAVTLNRLLTESAFERPRLDWMSGLMDLLAALILAGIAYLLYSFLLFVLARAFRISLNYRQARLLSGGSFPVPMVPISVISLPLYIWFSGQNIAYGLPDFFPPLAGLLVWGLILWGIVILIVSLRSATGASIPRVILSVMSSTVAMAGVFLGALFLLLQTLS